MSWLAELIWCCKSLAKGYQFTLDEKNMDLADEIFVALQILTKK
jgi:hypothetical protein